MSSKQEKILLPKKKNGRAAALNLPSRLLLLPPHRTTIIGLIPIANFLTGLPPIF
jgi:hypothetical protein